MLIRFRCKECGQRIQVRSEWAGRRGECPNSACRKPFKVPRVSAERLAELQAEQTEAPRPAARRSAAASPPPVVRRRPAGKKPTRRPRHRWYAFGGIAGLVILGLLASLLLPGGDSIGPSVATAEPSKPDAPPYSEIQPFFQQYCFDCHSGDYAEEGLALDGVTDLAGIHADRKKWEKVLKLVKVGAMPPSDMDQPSQEEREKVVAWLDNALFYVDCDAGANPGSVTIRRLNRTEYTNTIRDLVGVKFEAANDFPSDDVGYGFDNIGDVLTVPPLLIEKYLDAAEQIAAKAIITRDPDFSVAKTPAGRMESKGSARGRGRDIKTFPSNGTIHDDFEFTRPGEYVIRIEAEADQGGDELAKMKLELDDEHVKTFDVEGNKTLGVYEERINVSKTKQRIALSFINDFYDEKAKKDRNLYIHSVEIEGPFGLPEKLPEHHKRLVAKTPGDKTSVDDAARANLKPLLKRAFRRPVNDAEVAQYAKFVQLAVDRGESFERGMQVALQAVLVSPQFLFRVEDDERKDSQGRQLLSDYELASRLSYFLWSSMPDDELFRLADEKRLRDDKVLEQQVQRMLADDRASELIENFSGQWLGLRKLATNEVEPDNELFPEFNDQIRSDMWEETERFFGHVVREDRSVLDLISGRYTFVNERLAKFYGLDGIEGDEFRRVEFKEEPRSGIITHPSVLTLTSYPDRTSPVKRGEWVLANLLGDAPPDPPPLVPALEETRKANPDLPMRKQLELHREDPGCASCHVVMDEIGFGLENFDAIGRWRTADGKNPIDAVGTLPSGERFDGPVELVQILMERKDDFARCLSEKLLTYALGRGLEYYDRCAVEEITQRLQSNDYRFSALVIGIVKSEPFRLRGDGE